MKCMPTTRSGRPVAVPSRVMEIDDVLEARMVDRRTGLVELAEDLGLDVEPFLG